MSEPKGVTLAGVEQHLRVVAGYLPHEYVRVEIDRASLYAGADLVRAADRVVAAARNSFHIPLCKCDVCEALADFDRAGGGA